MMSDLVTIGGRVENAEMFTWWPVVKDKVKQI